MGPGNDIMTHSGVGSLVWGYETSLDSRRCFVPTNNDENVVQPDANMMEFDLEVEEIDWFDGSESESNIGS